MIIFAYPTENLLSYYRVHGKAGFPLANIFARSDFFPLSLSIRLKPSGTNRAQTKEKSRFARKYSLVENRLYGPDAVTVKGQGVRGRIAERAYL